MSSVLNSFAVSNALTTRPRPSSVAVSANTNIATLFIFSPPMFLQHLTDLREELLLLFLAVCGCDFRMSVRLVFFVYSLRMIRTNNFICWPENLRAILCPFWKHKCDQ